MAHYVSRGCGRRKTVFATDQDRRVYLMLLAKYLPLFEMALIGYSLGDARVELVVIPEKAQLFAEGIARLHDDFSGWRNPGRRPDARLWQRRLDSCPVDDDRVWAVVRCVELGPVREGLVRNAWDWEWSSARAHVTGIDPGGRLDMRFWGGSFTGIQWKRYLEQVPVETSLFAEIQRTSVTGRLLGSRAAARQLGLEMGIPLE